MNFNMRVAATPVRTGQGASSRNPTLRLTSLLLLLLPTMVEAQDWGAIANVSTTMGINANRICVGEASRGDIGCPTYAPSMTTAGDISVTGNLSAAKFYGDGSALTGVNTSVSVTTGLSGSLVFRDEYGSLQARSSLSVSSTTGSVGIGAGAPGFLGNNGFYVLGQTYLSDNLILGSGKNVAWGNYFTNINGSNSTGNQNLAFTVSGTEALRIVSTGYVGIGTATPSNTLHVYSPVSFGGAIIQSPDPVLDLIGTGARALRFRHTTAGTLWSVGTSSSTGDYFYIGGGSLPGQTPMMTIVSTGFVGIGTTNPSERLEVNGNIRARGGTWYSDGTNMAVRVPVGGTFYVQDVSSGFATLNTGSLRIPSGGAFIASGGSSSAPSTTLQVSGTLRISNGAEACDTNRLGAIRFAAGSFDVCKNTTNGWEPLSTSTSSTTPSISSGLSGSIVFRDEYGYLKANNTFSISSTTGSVGIGAGPPGWLGNNGLYATGSMSAQGYIGQYYRFDAGNSAITGDGLTGAHNNYISFKTSNTEALRIVSTGYVGIGTASPLGQLHVKAVAGDAFAYFDAAAGYGSQIYTRANVSGGSYFRYLGGADLSNNRKFAVGQFGTTEDYNIGFYNGPGLTEKMTIVSTGYVGIGTTAPNANLTVSGTAKFIAAPYGNTQFNFTPLGNGTDVGAVDIRTADAGSVLSARAVGSSYSSNAGIFRAIAENTTGTANYYFIGRTSNTTNFSVRADGRTFIAENLGIGTTAPSETLHVSGTMQIGNGGPALVVQGSGGSSQFGLKLSQAGSIRFKDFNSTGIMRLNADGTAAGSGVFIGYDNGSASVYNSTTLHVSGTIKISNGGEACDTSRLGAIRYTSGAFSVCQSVSNGWEALGTTGANANNDRIISGTTQAIAYSNTSLSLVTAGTERVVIGTNGNVGIGQQPASDVTLGLSGTALITSNAEIRGIVSTSAVQLAENPSQSCNPSTYGTIKIVGGRLFVCKQTP